MCRITYQHSFRVFVTRIRNETNLCSSLYLIIGTKEEVFTIILYQTTRPPRVPIFFSPTFVRSFIRLHFEWVEGRRRRRRKDKVRFSLTKVRPVRRLVGQANAISRTFKAHTDHNLLQPSRYLSLPPFWLVVSNYLSQLGPRELQKSYNETVTVVR